MRTAGIVFDFFGGNLARKSRRGQGSRKEAVQISGAADLVNSDSRPGRDAAKRIGGGGLVVHGHERNAASGGPGKGVYRENLPLLVHHLEAQGGKAVRRVSVHKPDTAHPGRFAGSEPIGCHSAFTGAASSSPMGDNSPRSSLGQAWTALTHGHGRPAEAAVAMVSRHTWASAVRR